MIPVDLPQRVGSMIRRDPESRSLGSDPGIHFRDPRTCLIEILHRCTGLAYLDTLHSPIISPD